MLPLWLCSRRGGSCRSTTRSAVATQRGRVKCAGGIGGYQPEGMALPLGHWPGVCGLFMLKMQRVHQYHPHPPPPSPGLPPPPPQAAVPHRLSPVAHRPGSASHARLSTAAGHPHTHKRACASVGPPRNRMAGAGQWAPLCNMRRVVEHAPPFHACGYYPRAPNAEATRTTAATVDANTVYTLPSLLPLPLPALPLPVPPLPVPLTRTHVCTLYICSIYVWPCVCAHCIAVDE